MLLDLRNVDWQPFLKQQCKSGMKLYELNLQAIYDNRAPVHEKRIKGCNCPWLTNDTTNETESRELAVT